MEANLKIQFCPVKGDFSKWRPFWTGSKMNYIKKDENNIKIAQKYIQKTKER